MEFEAYFEPVPEDLVQGINHPDQNQIAFKLIPAKEFFSADKINVDLALIGVPEDRAAIDNKGSAESVNDIRKSLYSLFDHNHMKAVDLGNIKPGHTIHDTYLALSSVVNELMIRNIVPVIIGGKIGRASCRERV